MVQVVNSFGNFSLGGSGPGSGDMPPDPGKFGVAAGHLPQHLVDGRL